MNTDLCLLIGLCVVVALMAFEGGFKMAEGNETPAPIPSDLNEIAVSLACLHESHTEAQATMNSAKEKSNIHQDKLKDFLDRVLHRYSVR